MLLSELVELLAAHFNILNDDITNVLKVNNIRIGQRLLLEKKDNNMITSDQTKVITNKVEEKMEEKTDQKKKGKSKEEKVVIVEKVEPKVEPKVEEKVEEKIETKENKPTRGRGRPKKNMIMKEEEDEEICVEVEEVDVCGVKYYKTSENVILSKALEIEGIMRDGKLVRTNK
jgi:hypothetical protein